MDYPTTFVSDEDEENDGEVEIEKRQFDENEDAVTDEDQAYMKFLAEIRTQIRKRLTKLC